MIGDVLVNAMAFMVASSLGDGSGLQCMANTFRLLNNRFTCVLSEELIVDQAPP